MACSQVSRKKAAALILIQTFVLVLCLAVGYISTAIYVVLTTVPPEFRLPFWSDIFRGQLVAAVVVCFILSRVEHPHETIYLLNLLVQSWLGVCLVFWMIFSVVRCRMDSVYLTACGVIFAQACPYLFCRNSDQISPLSTESMQ